MNLADIKGIGDKTASVLSRHGINSVDELLSYYPRMHRIYHKQDINSAKVGEWVTLIAKVSRPTSRHTGHLTLQFATCHDSSGRLTLRWFNSPFIVRSIKDDQTYQILGKIEVFANTKQIVNPTLLPITKQELLPDPFFQPIYTPLGTLKSAHIRRIIKNTLEIFSIQDPLKGYDLAKNHLYPKSQAISEIHFPSSSDSLNRAIYRLGFDELVDLQLESLKLKENISPPTEKLLGDQIVFDAWIHNLPFDLTTSQKEAINAILADLSRGRAMHRLITGDVGSGKTVLAVASSLWTHLSGKRTLMLAPTLVLAKQLYNNFVSLLPKKLDIDYATSTHQPRMDANIIIGTHALLNKPKLQSNLGLVIIDEQHRFGVKDREILRNITPTPHLLMLSATPIPRSLAMTTLSHLDVTPISQMPKGRLETKSYLVTKDKYLSAYNWVKTQVMTHNQQVFIVTPVIDQAENQEESPKTALTTLTNDLKQKFPDISIDYLHGRLKDQEKNSKLDAFRQGKTQILVATSMIEVGVDIPKANIMIIENAELFGLSTLHQLRGRVGRGGQQGYCLLITKSPSQTQVAKLKYFVSENNGLKIAEYDLENRGAGDIFGTLQSGNLNSLRFANLKDKTILDQAKLAAKSLLTSQNALAQKPV